MCIDKRIKNWIDEHAEEMISAVQSFARIRSVSRADLAEEGAPFGRECREMLDHVLAYAEKLGFETQNHEGYMGSVIYGSGEKEIGMIGHSDVVPEGDKWIYPPYGATRKGDFLIGRGVSDNKSAVVLSLYILKMFKDLELPLNCRLRAMVGCSEETGMQDLAYYVKHYGEPDVTLIPDAGFPANYAQKGSMRGTMKICLGEQLASFTGGEVANMVPPHAQAVVKGISIDALKPHFDDSFTLEECDGGVLIKAKGVAAHAAAPEHGVNAIHLLSTALCSSGLLSGQSQKAMTAVSEMTKDYYGANAGIANEDPDTGKTTMVCGVAKMCGDNEMSLSLDCRLSIAADADENVASFTKYAESLGFTAHGMKCTPPVFMAKDDPRMVAVMNAYREISGDYESQPYAMGGGTYARELKNGITFGIGFPGSDKKPEGLPENHGGAHGPDEIMYIPNFLKAFEVYAAAIMELDSVI